MQQPRQQLYRKLLGTSCATFAVFLLAFCLVPTLMSEASAAENVSAAVSWDAISLTLNPNGDIDFGEVIPSSRDTSIGNYGTQKVAKKSIEVTTNGDYYAVYLSTIDNNNALRTSSDAIQAIPAITSSLSPASSFMTTSWGFAIPSQETATTYSAYDSFLVSSSDAQANNLTKLGTGSSVYNTGLWSGVPTLADTAQIYRNTTNIATGFSAGDSFPIYYSIMVDTDTMAGTYANQVVYTAIATTSRGDISYNVARSKEIATSYVGETETLRLDLAATSTGTTPALTTNDLEIRLVPHSIIATNNYTVDSLISTDYPTCTPTSVTASGQSAEIICTMPRFGAKGSTDTSGTHTVADNSAYDFWVKLTLPDESIVNYVSHYKESATDVASVTYKVGLQSKNASGNTIVTSMQQMTPNICQATNMWGSGTGTTAQIYDYRGESGDNTNVGQNDTSIAAGTDSIGFASFTLTDNRDDKDYLIRRLADGNCWMVQNLDLDLAEVSLTKQNTNNPSDAFISGTIAKQTVWSSVNWGISYLVLEEKGGYYNYYTATAGHGDSTLTSGNAPGDICPYGWRLPIGGTNGESEFQAINDIYNNSSKKDPTNWYRLPNNYIIGGVFSRDGTAEPAYLTRRTDIWSSSTSPENGNISARGLYLDNETNIVDPASHRGDGWHARYDGKNVRCVAR